MKELEKLGYSIQEVKEMTKNSDKLKSFCYQLIKEYGNNQIIIENIAKVIGLSVSDIKHHARLYKPDNHMNYSMMLANKKKEADIDLIKEFLKINLQDINRIVDFLKKNSDLYKYTTYYLELITNASFDNPRIERQAYKARLIAFRDYLYEQKKLKEAEKNTRDSENTNHEASKIFELILNDHEVKSFEEVRGKYNIADYTIRKVNKVFREKMFNSEITMFDKIQEIFHANKNHYLEQYVDMVTKVFPLINSGIIVNNQMRPFDIFDCYTYFGHDINKVIDVLRYRFPDVKSANEQENQAINKLKAILLKYTAKVTSFYSVGVNHTDLEYQKEFIHKALNETLEINPKIIDEKIVYGSGHIVTKEEKEQIFEALNDYPIPFNYEMYLLATKRLNNGRLELITQDTIDNYLESLNVKKGQK